MPLQVGLGDIQLDQAGPVQLKSGVGDISVNRAAGDSQITTGSGALVIGSTTARRWSRTPTATRGSARSRATCG